MTEQITGAARLTVVSSIFTNTSIKTIQTCVVFVQKSLLLALGMVVHFCCPNGARLLLSLALTRNEVLRWSFSLIWDCVHNNSQSISLFRCDNPIPLLHGRRRLVQ